MFDALGDRMESFIDFTKIKFPPIELLIKECTKEYPGRFKIFDLGVLGSGFLTVKDKAKGRAIQFVFCMHGERPGPFDYLVNISASNENYEQLQQTIIVKCKELYKMNFDCSESWEN